MRRTKQVIAIVVVATALCADRSLAVAPAVTEAPTPSLARTLASRLTTTLRRSVAPMRMLSTRTNEASRPSPLVICEPATGVRTPVSLLVLHLPPPVL